MTPAEALRIIGGISTPSKMPGTSWSISAWSCQTGSKLAEQEGTVCEGCYARKGMYRFGNVKAALNRREEALKDPLFKDAFIMVLTNTYKNTRKTRIKNGAEIKENRHRWFDSGDLGSVAVLKLINEIALATPFIDHWLPTKESGYVNQFMKTNKFSKNLTVRLSHPMIGGTFKVKPNGLNFSTVGYKEAANHCPAYQQGGKCLNCDNCWDASVTSVNYPQH